MASSNLEPAAGMFHSFTRSRRGPSLSLREFRAAWEYRLRERVATSLPTPVS